MMLRKGNALHLSNALKIDGTGLDVSTIRDGCTKAYPLGPGAGDMDICYPLMEDKDAWTSKAK